VVGNAFVQLHALRARSRRTQHRLADGETIGAETSIDKVLVATAEQITYDCARRLLPGVIEMDDRAAAEMWRSEYLYSRAATIYGGTAEVQRNIIARRLLDLGADE
jgi:alkylation response protein AidB-like acyl-CoA dehydrogenase